MTDEDVFFLVFISIFMILGLCCSNSNEEREEVIKQVNRAIKEREQIKYNLQPYTHSYRQTNYIGYDGISNYVGTTRQDIYSNGYNTYVQNSVLRDRFIPYNQNQRITNGYYY